MTHSSGHALWILAVAVVAGACVYLLAFARLRTRGASWSGWHAVAFLAGAIAVAVSLVPPMAPLAHRDLRVHMMQHLLLGMFGPIGIVAGRPVTLTLRNLAPATARKLVALLHSRTVRSLTHPFVALVLNIGGMAALYLTPLYEAMAHDATLHLLVHVHFILAGCLFTWSILALEPAARAAQSTARTRLIFLFLGIGTHAAIAKSMYAFGFPRGTIHGAEELRDAAIIMYYGGDLSELIVLILLFATWWPRARTRSSGLLVSS